MSTIKENIANNIAELRKMNHMTQQDLAEKLNYTDKAISKWERGESTPDVESLSAIAKMFNLTVDDLFEAACENGFSGTKLEFIAEYVSTNANSEALIKATINKNLLSSVCVSCEFKKTSFL